MVRRVLHSASRKIGHSLYETEQVGFILIFVLLKYDAFDNLLDGVLKGFLRLFGIDSG